ncbi:hypothetical protein [Persicobacter psychrovividus]|uniref:J domain-containing protein n=1 Tax=Persicobacter psychrovividus TaxID=387638 RepID=A0ABM7VB97_9BACT|nr:hypothetical protein PEPS_04850 [Persicobacter psychrovividus]
MFEVVAIKGAGGENLSKEQRQFNRLTKQIQNLHVKIEKEENKLEQLLEIYQKEIKPTERLLFEARVRFLKKADKIYKKFKFNKRQAEDIEEVLELILVPIIEMMDQPDDEVIALYNRYSENTYEEEMQEQSMEMMDELEDMINNMFGVDVDFSDLDPEKMNTPEGMAEIAQKLKEQMGQQFEQEQKEQKEAPKTKKQIERELNAKQEEMAKLKSLKGIYFSLAKVLHPDTARTEEERVQREELMKEVTAAYKAKDLPALLKLEMQWLSSENEHLEKLTQEQLSLYIRVLKEQVKELKGELEIIKMNPRYNEIGGLVDLGIQAAKREIKEALKGMKDFIAVCEKDTQQLNSRKQLLIFTEEMLEEAAAGETDDEMEMFEDFFRMMDEMDDDDY